MPPFIGLVPDFASSITFGKALVKALRFQTPMRDGLLGVISLVNSFKPKRSGKKPHQKRRGPGLLDTSGELSQLIRDVRFIQRVRFAYLRAICDLR
jgi:hypothetical protein